MLRLLIVFLIISSQLFSQSLKSPEEFLGYKVGTDYKIADYETIQKYFKHLAEHSNKIVYEEIGKSVQKRDMFMAIISTEENIKNLERYRNIVKTLSDPRKITEDEAKKLSKEGKVVVLVTCNIHSTEIASSQMSMELAYDLIVNSAPPKINDALNDVIFILMPSINPDGTTMMVNWYNKYLNTEYDGSSMPYLYHVYAGHNNNRDWFMFNLPETRNVINIAWHKWFPQIWLDQHQMGSSGARLFVVPYKDPINPNVHPLIWKWHKVIGGLTSLHLEQQGFTGIIDQAIFEGWWQGPASDCGLWHNQIALLSEMASCNIASPIYIDPSEVRATTELTTYDIRTNYSNPWRGGWWRLRDIVDYEIAMTYSLIETSSMFKEDFLFNYYLMGRDAVEKGKTEKPFAFIVPRNQNDPITTSKMIEVLQLAGVEVHFSDKEFKIDNVTYPADSYVIQLAQPKGRYVKDLLEEQLYPDLRKAKTESPIRPYDVAGWTLPYLMGVKYFQIDKPFTSGFQLLTDANYQKGKVEESEGKYFIAPAGLNVNSTLINRLQKRGVQIFLLNEKIKISEKEFSAGSVVIAQNSKIREQLRKLADELHVEIFSVGEIDKSKLKELKKVKVGLYQPFTANMDEGWTRLLLENFEFDFVTLHNKDFKTKNLKEKYDVIIIPSMSGDLIKTGYYQGENARYNRPKPPEYDSGIGRIGLENLKSFVEKDGGFVITLGEACNFAIEDLGLRVTNTLKNIKSDQFFCPGSLIKINVDNSHPIGYGLEDEIIGYQNSNIAFQTSIPFGQFDRTVIARYPTLNLLKSGYLLGEDYLYKKAAIVDVKQKKGRVILMGFGVQNRHQTFGTFKLLFNAIHYAGLTD
ncbi:MAG: peptidase M14 family protein [Bacteroidetes bacterium]|nr:peptidase M14 family protein [Bacteroidota bacterium]MBU2584885.1 peptidase M14 family protein [Bacteroidota bacterium]